MISSVSWSNGMIERVGMELQNKLYDIGGSFSLKPIFNIEVMAELFKRCSAETVMGVSFIRIR